MWNPLHYWFSRAALSGHRCFYSFGRWSMDGTDHRLQQLNTPVWSRPDALIFQNMLNIRWNATVIFYVFIFDLETHVSNYLTYSCVCQLNQFFRFITTNKHVFYCYRSYINRSRLNILWIITAKNESEGNLINQKDFSGPMRHLIEYDSTH